MRTTARRAGQAVKRAAQKAGRMQDPPAPERARRRLADPKAERRQRLLASNLTELAIEFRTDKWGVHRYTPHYERHLQHLRRDSFTLLELGIGGYKKRRKSGASMKMWRWFFPRATHRRPRHRGQDVADPRPHPHLPRRPDRPRDPAADHRGAGRAAGRHRRRQPHPRPRARVVQDPLPADARRRDLLHRGHPDVLLAGLGRRARPPRAGHLDGPRQGPHRRPQPRGVPRRGLRGRPTPTSGSGPCTATTTS